MAKEKFYTLDAILAYDADYNMIYGERSMVRLLLFLNTDLKTT